LARPVGAPDAATAQSRPAIAGWIGSLLQRALGGEIGSFAITTQIGVRSARHLLDC